jgi:hypothetical protein
MFRESTPQRGDPPSIQIANTKSNIIHTTVDAANQYVTGSLNIASIPRMTIATAIARDG